MTLLGEVRTNCGLGADQPLSVARGTRTRAASDLHERGVTVANAMLCRVTTRG